MLKETEAANDQGTSHSFNDANLMQIFPVPSELQESMSVSKKPTIRRAKDHLSRFTNESLPRFFHHNKKVIFDGDHDKDIQAAMRRLMVTLFKLGQVELVCRKKLDIDAMRSIKHCRTHNLFHAMMSDMSPVQPQNIVHPFLLPRSAEGDPLLPLGYGMYLTLPLWKNRPAKVEKFARQASQYAEKSPYALKTKWLNVKSTLETIAAKLGRQQSPESRYFLDYSYQVEDLFGINATAFEKSEYGRLLHPNRQAKKTKQSLKKPKKNGRPLNPKKRVREHSQLRR